MDSSSHRGPRIMRATSARKRGGCCRLISSRQASRSRRSWTHPFRGRAMNSDRRRVLKTAVFAAAALGLLRIGSTSANQVDPIKPGTSPSLGALKQVDAGVLNIGYAEVGPSGGPPVVLLHGWPYDIHTYEDVAPLLASAGYRVLVPFLRGYGTTRFLSKETPRNGQQSVIAV